MKTLRLERLWAPTLRSADHHYAACGEISSCSFNCLKPRLTNQEPLQAGLLDNEKQEDVASKMDVLKASEVIWPEIWFGKVDWSHAI